jgi:hypothetical protein
MVISYIVVPTIDALRGAVVFQLVAIWALLTAASATNTSITPLAGGARGTIPAICAALYPNALHAINDILYIADGSHFVFQYSYVWQLDTASVHLVAGLGFAAFGSDNRPATDSALDTPMGLASSSNGSLYISDMGSHRIRMVTPEGWIYTIAGTGVAGYSGDGGMAVNATLYHPRGLAVNAEDALFIADSDNNVIRRVQPSGIITTVTGINVGLTVPLDVSMNEDTGGPNDVIIVDYGNNRIVMFNGTTVAASLPAPIVTQAPLSFCTASFQWWVSYPCAIYAMVPGDVWFSVVGNGTCGNTDRFYTAPTTGATLLNQVVSIRPYLGATVFTDTNNRRIRRISEGAQVTTIAGSEMVAPAILSYLQATDITLSAPMAVARTVYSSTILIADAGSNRVWEILTDGSIRVFAGSDTGTMDDNIVATSVLLSRPSGVEEAAWLGCIFVADTGNARILRIDQDYRISLIAIGNGTTGTSCSACPPTTSLLNGPTGLTWDDLNRRLYIAETGGNMIKMVDYSIVPMLYTIVGLASLSGYPSNVSALSSRVLVPMGVAYLANTLTYTDTGSHCIRQVAITNNITMNVVTTLAGTCGAQGSGIGALSATTFHKPAAVALTDMYTIYVSDTGNNRLVCINLLDATVRVIAGSGAWTPTSQLAYYNNPLSYLGAPHGLDVFNGSVLLTDSLTNRVWEIVVAPTPVPSSSPSVSITSTRTATVSTTGNVTVSPLASPSMSRPGSPNVTHSITRSASNSTSPLPSISISASYSNSYSATPSKSASGSWTVSPSSAASVTSSSSGTATPSISSSFTHTYTPTVTYTPSVSNTITWTGTSTVTPSLTGIVSSSMEGTGTPTITNSATNSQTRSGTTSNTITCSSSTSPSPTGTSSVSVTLIPSGSVSIVPSRSGTSTLTSIPSRSTSITSTVTSTFTGTSTVTGTGAGTGAGTPSTSVLGMPSRSPTTSSNNTLVSAGNVVMPTTFLTAPVGTAVLTLSALCSLFVCCLFPLCFAYRRHIHHIRERNEERGVRKTVVPLSVSPAVFHAVRNIHVFTHGEGQEESEVGTSLLHCRAAALGGSVEDQKEAFAMLYAGVSKAGHGRGGHGRGGEGRGGSNNEHTRCDDTHHVPTVGVWTKSTSSTQSATKSECA